MDYLKGFALNLGMLPPLVLVPALVKKTLQWMWLGLALGYLAGDFCLTVFADEIPGLNFKSLSWNWVGKGAAILFAIAFLAASPNVRRESGVVRKICHGSWAGAVLILALIAGGGVYLGLQSGAEPFRKETVFFQTFMPSISEELVFRGILLCLLSRAMGISFHIKNIEISWAVPALVIWFGTGHAVFWTASGIQIAWIYLAVTTAVGGALMWLRLLTGSVWLPILGHTMFNLATTVIPMVRSGVP